MRPQSAASTSELPTFRTALAARVLEFVSASTAFSAVKPSSDRSAGVDQEIFLVDLVAATCILRSYFPR